MIKRRRVKQTDILEDRLLLEATRLREEAKGMKPGPAREAILRKIRQAETGAHMSEWLRSPGLQPPK
jgi:hypothetical protein